MGVPGIIPARAGFTTSSGTARWPATDHPRSRGVYAGSGDEVCCWLGIIPARAGFTLVALCAVGTGSDHPRSRGVYRILQASSPRHGGSSPLARGLLAMPPYSILDGGIIPARAGFTAMKHQGKRPQTGSSPLARGLRGRGRRGPPTGRIIPARAGFTRAGWSPIPAGGDHPRSRGVYRGRLPWTVEHSGSSPLARGLLSRGNFDFLAVRIIPARAGFTLHQEPLPHRRGDHPRSRGVYFNRYFALRGAGGSSPLARGLLRTRCGHPRRRRIIPARAGFTVQSAMASPAIRDHPRSRGVYHGGFLLGMVGVGSSPLARGLPPRRADGDDRTGIIPARAGFTSTTPR